MERFAPNARNDAYGRRINREHSRVLARTLPWLSVMMGSLVPLVLIATALPLSPPLGYIALISWRLVRPGLLPVWAGAPLGFFDDLFSGQPLGSGMVLWSFTMLAIELLDRRFPWRSFAQDWLVAAGAIIGYLLATFLVSGATPTKPALIALGPQTLLAVLLFPASARAIATLDRLRLSRWRMTR